MKVRPRAARTAETSTRGAALRPGSSRRLEHGRPADDVDAELFREEQPDVNVTVGTSGTGGGFERFCAGETDISNASRPIDEEESPLCPKNAAIEYTELQVAVDALTVVTNAENDWATCLTVDQLNAIWEPKSRSQLTDVPDGDPDPVEMPLAGPGTDSGTFDSFTDEINGEGGASRSDYTACEDDNVIVQAVQDDPRRARLLRLHLLRGEPDHAEGLEVDGERVRGAERRDCGQDGAPPLSRPLFVYVKNESLANRGGGVPPLLPRTSTRSPSGRSSSRPTSRRPRRRTTPSRRPSRQRGGA